MSSSEDEKELSLVEIQIRKTVNEMIEQRGYRIIGVEDDILVAVKPNEEKMCVFLKVNEKFNIDEFKNCVANMEEMNIHHSIVICNDITPATKKMLMNTTGLRTATNSKSKDIESFMAQDLRVNKTKHRLVPKHEKVPADEAVRIMDKYPILKFSDPIARFYAFKRGDLIKITRHDGYVAYRIVR